MTPEEKKARAALENIPVANYATVKVFLDVAVRIIARAIREAVAEEREACAQIALSKSVTRDIKNAIQVMQYNTSAAAWDMACATIANLIRAQAKQGMNKETI